MKKRYIFFIVTSILFVIGICWGTSLERLKIDGISGEVWDLFFSSDTRYAKGYSDKKFTEIKVGMTEQEVLKILGEPLLRWTPYRLTNFPEKEHYVGFQYSESPSSTNYRLRQVYLKNGTIAEKIGYFYVD